MVTWRQWLASIYPNELRMLGRDLKEGRSRVLSRNAHAWSCTASLMAMVGHGRRASQGWPAPCLF